MKIASAAALAVLVASAACHSSSSGGAEPAPTTAPAPSSPPAAAAEKAGDLPSLTDFEGQVDLMAKGSASAAPVPLTLLVKNETLRIDAPPELLAAHEARAFTGGGKVYAIIKPADKKTFVVLDGKRQALSLDLDTISQQAKALRAAHGGGDTAAEPPPKVVKTGKKEMVAGYSCEDWDITSAKSKAVVCVAEKASFFHFPSLGVPTEQAWALELVDGKHFPLKAVSFGKDGTEEGRLEVTKIEKHSLDASMFEVPMGYKQVTIEELLSGAIPSDGPHGMPHPHGHHHHH